ncbi:hypothetical protein ACFQX7_32385 [Luedemannella flava]
MFAAVVPLITWAAVIGAAYLTVPPTAIPVVAKPELVYGVPLVQCALGALLAAVLVPARAANRS